MLPEKPWRTDAILRLMASVLVCVFLGSAIDPVLRCLTDPSRPVPPLFFVATAGAVAAFVAALVFLMRPWTPETFIRGMAGALGGFYGGFCFVWWQSHLVPSGPAGEPLAWWRALLNVASFQGACLLLAPHFLREHRTTWAEAFGLGQNVARALRHGAIAAVVILPVAMMLQLGVRLVLKQFADSEPPEQTAVQVIRESPLWPGKILLGFITIVLVPPAEELLFRGILYPAVKRAGFPRLALWGTSLAFAAIHFDVSILIPLLVLALLLVRLYEKTGNLLAPIVAHSLFNALNFTLLLTWPWIETQLPWLSRK